MTYFFKKPFAENGDITTIPVESQGEGYVSYDKGWEEGYELDPMQDPEDARNLSRTNFNGLFFNITSVLQEFQKMGANPYITASDNDGEPFPYPEGGLCYYTDLTTGEFAIYRSTIGNNTTYPSVNGYTNNNWQKVWSAQLDTIKSNRLRNCILSMPTLPYLGINGTTGTVTIPEGMRVLFSNGFREDHTLKSDIVTYINNVFQNIDISNPDNLYSIFATSDSSILVIKQYQYLDSSAVDPMTEDLLPDSSYYYFNTSLNKWMIKEAGTSAFVQLGYSLCLVADLTNANGEWLLNVSDVLEINTSSTSQSVGTSIVNRINYDLESTNFCVNKCNLDASNDPDLLYTDTRTVYKQNTIIQPGAANGVVTTNSGLWYNPLNGWAQGNNYITLGAQTMVNTSPYGYELTYKFNEPVLMMPSPRNNPTAYVGLSISSVESHYIYCNNWDWCYDAHVVTYNTFVGRVYFTDGTYYEFMRLNGVWSSVYLQNTLSNSYTAWKNFTFYIYTDEVKYIDRVVITVIANAYKGNINYRNYSFDYIYSYWAISYAYLSNININVQQTEQQIVSHDLKFKVGSNYLEKLSAYTPLIDTSNGTISGDRFLTDIWKGKSVVSLSNDIEEFTSTFTFREEPTATNNAKLFVRFLNKNLYAYIEQLTVTLVYKDNSTYDIINHKYYHDTIDTLVNVPANKIIKKIIISGQGVHYSEELGIGLVQIYNNVSNSEIFTQYPAMYGTSGNGQKLLMQYDCPPISLNTSGYVMMAEAGIYILPGTNVIYKQKSRPSSPREGDVWFNYSEEPLNAYQYKSGEWRVFHDVPIGYVTLAYSDPSTTIIPSEGLTATCNASTFAQQAGETGTYTFTYNGTSWTYLTADTTLSDWGITITSGTPTNGSTLQVIFEASESTISSIETYPLNQNGYNVNAFTNISGALVGRDGRDGVNGKDGKNGAPGPQGPAGVGIPTGGLTGQVLAKSSNANYATKWTTMASTALFDGGEAGMTLVKNSSADLDFSWGRVSGVPSGGTTGQVLKKNSSTDQDCSWGSVEALPQGGETGQVLVKLSNSNYNVGWTSMPNTMTLLNKSNFKIDSYFVGVVNSYTGLTLEQFINSSGINSTADDGATVISTYYSSQECKVTNSSNNTIAFRLNEITTTNPIRTMQIEAETTGTVAFSYSTNGGTTFTSINKSTATQIESSSLIIKIQLQAAAVISNVAILVK